MQDPRGWQYGGRITFFVRLYCTHVTNRDLKDAGCALESAGMAFFVSDNDTAPDLAWWELGSRVSQ